VAHITALAQLAKMAPDAFESKSDVIMAFLLKEVLMTPSVPDPVRGLSSVIGCSPSILQFPQDVMDDGEEWVEDDDVSPALSAKVLSLKVCRNRSLAHASSDTALEISTPVLKMFATLLEHSGSFTADAADE